MILVALLLLAIRPHSVGAQLNFDLDTIREGMETISNLLDSLDNSIDNDECVYSCSPGHQLVANSTHVAKSDGCGSLGIDVDLSHLPVLTRCCDVHDLCYDKCNSNRDKCDKTFHQCLFTACESVTKRNSRKKTSFITVDVCKITSELIYQAVTNLGCMSFLDAQKSACVCVPFTRRTSDEL